ncbi:hypothetical protein QMF80_33515, partial [Streptomyces sp. G-G2]|nr:hypothetical protein [Streptomyces sp. G-G2]
MTSPRCPCGWARTPAQEAAPEAPEAPVGSWAPVRRAPSGPVGPVGSPGGGRALGTRRRAADGAPGCR